MNPLQMNAKIICLLLIMSVSFSQTFSQDNYEIQVYGSETMDKGSTMFELHSNYVIEGQKTDNLGVLPTNHVLHETVEITHGFTSFFEVGFYFFNTIGSDHRTGYVGSHIRPRVMVPKEWKWPVGLSLSVEGGFQKREYSEDDWSLEIRPIIDKQFGNLYISLNPTFDKSFHGLNKDIGFTFSPNVKAAYGLTKVIAAGLEYYGSVGPLNNIDPAQVQQHQLFFAVDLTWSPVWEFNCGYGWGLTPSTDRSIFKVILGYRLK